VWLRQSAPLPFTLLGIALDGWSAGEPADQSALEIVPARARHIGFLARHMRAVDRRECAAMMGRDPRGSLRHALAASTQAWTALVEGRPHAMFGLVIESALTGRGVPWFLGTDEVWRHCARCWPSGRRFSPRCTIKPDPRQPSLRRQRTGDPPAAKMGIHREPAHHPCGRPGLPSVRARPPPFDAGEGLMCGPALPLLAAGLAVARTGIGTISAMHQAQAQREAALQQAEQERAAARDAQDETARALADQYRAMAATEGRQRVAAAAGGVSVDFGTAREAIDSTRLTGTARAQDIAAQGASALRQNDAAAAQAMGRASMAATQGQTALWNGVVDMGQSVLSGVRQYRALRSRIG
jgi:hypothetical protein